MKKIFIIILMLAVAAVSHASSILMDGFEYANHDGETPTGWITANESWLCGYLDKDHNRVAHSGSWYAYTNAAESWMFMPMNMNTTLKYRFNLWAIADGGFQLEIWAGNEASPSAMSQLMLSETVSSSSYTQLSSYIEEIADNYQYFGIHAVSAYSDYYLTIDDIDVEMVDKYGLLATPAMIETDLANGAQGEFNFNFKNVGYEPLTVYVTPISEYFEDIHVFANGVESPTFPAEPEEIVKINGYATLSPNNPVGSRCWIDIMFTLDCGCATAMFTYMVTVTENGIEENIVSTSIYPNPSTGTVTIEGNGNVSIANSLGQEVLKAYIIDKETFTLEKGIYFVKINDSPAQKIIVEF